ncbi:hypothetical protein [Streptomyces murinus]|uniref:hypothetical protein n=1 Tax=Streptomyces murinus TaxID=33900 RepID=UPI0018F3F3B8|nr:hypothetical protein [Streptomyces murinus]
MNTRSVNAAAGVIQAALERGRTATGVAMALESAQLLQSPERAAEFERLKAERDEFCDRVDTLTAVAKGNKRHVAELFAELQKMQRERDEALARVAELEAQRDRRRARLVALQNDALNIRGALSPNGEARKVPMPLGETLLPAVEWLINRVAELEAERHSTNEALDDAVQELRARRDAEVVGRSVEKLTRMLAPSPVEDPHDSPLHHGYRLGRDLPPLGGVS